MWEIVPENLIAAMQRAGMNQSQLANAVGVKQPSIGRLVSGETKTTRALDLIASALGTTSAYLKGKRAIHRERVNRSAGAAPDCGGQS
jgi:transcriptional regulator with XRE-family HTH domain